jgi:hypothetical protein
MSAPPQHNFVCSVLVAATLLIGTAAQAQSKADDSADNGTDPTKFSTSAALQLEHVDLKGGVSADTLQASYATPLGSKRDFNLRLLLPMVRTDVAGRSGFRMGDASLKVNHLYTLTREYGIVLGGELVLDTADRPEAGNGMTVFKANVVYAKFLQGGDIFAPAVVHSFSLGSDKARGKVNGTVFDFYYVPKLADPKTFVTLDPALSFNWENHTRFASLAVTVGRAIGPAFGGNSQITLKPTLFAGGDRPGKWGLQLGYKVIGF